MNFGVTSELAQPLAEDVHWNPTQARCRGAGRHNHDCLRGSQFGHPPGHAKAKCVLDHGADDENFPANRLVAIDGVGDRNCGQGHHLDPNTQVCEQDDALQRPRVEKSQPGDRGAEAVISTAVGSRPTASAAKRISDTSPLSFPP